MNRLHISENKLDRSNFSGPNFLGFDSAQPAKVLFTQPAKVLSACVEARVGQGKPGERPGETRCEVIYENLLMIFSAIFSEVVTSFAALSDKALLRDVSPKNSPTFFVNSSADSTITQAFSLRRFS